jgi:hypothetical protein
VCPGLHKTHRTGHNLHLPFSDYPAWYALVPFPLRIAGADWNVWQFCNEKRDNDRTFRKGIDDLPTVPIILSEWTNLNPDNINRMLHNANDWAAIKKMLPNLMQKPSRKVTLKQRLKRMETNVGDGCKRCIL